MDFESITLFVENDILTAAFDFAYCTNEIVVIVLVNNFFKNASQCSAAMQKNIYLYELPYTEIVKSGTIRLSSGVKHIVSINQILYVQCVS